MATTTKKTTQGRPKAKARKPSLARPKTVKKSPVKRKHTAKKVVVKKQTNKKPPVRRRVAAKPVIRQLQVPLGRGRHLKLAVSVSQPSKKASRKKLTISRQLQAHLSIAMIVLGVIGSVYFGSQVLASPPPAPVAAELTLVTPYRPASETMALPKANALKVQIPDVAIDAEVISIGKQADGTLEVPSDASKVGLYSLGPSPGEVGPAIIVGHVDSLTGPAVFWRLRELLPGQIVHVPRQDGTTARFKVDRVQEYAQDAFPTNEVYGDINYAGLRLITCGGSFDILSRHYSHNTVVYASLIP